MNITKGKLILLLSVSLAIALTWGISTTLRLSTAKATLHQTLVTLSHAQNELADTKQQLTNVGAELLTTQNSLTQAKIAISQTQMQLDTSKAELSDVQSSLSDTQNQLSNVQSQLSDSQQQLSDYQKTMQALDITVHSSAATWNINGLNWAHTDNPQATNPTWNQLVTFVQQDNTDKHPYNLSSFNCVNYATTVYADAEKLNIESAIVLVGLKNSTTWHVANAFITSDYGLVYIDCTTRDTVARIEAGQIYEAVPLSAVQPNQVRNDSWWDTSKNYYYLPDDSGGMATVDSIDIYW